MKKEFQAESKKLLDMMIHSIYTHKDIFLRELISNSSDAIDKIYYKTLGDENLVFEKDNYKIKIKIDKENRILEIEDFGIGMTKEELEQNLGVIAKSGSFDFKEENNMKDGFDIIGQFGVGFYSAFMVAKKVSVLSKSFSSDEAYLWESEGADGYTITAAKKDEVGTKITLYIQDSSEDEDYNQYLEKFKIESIIKKYSDFIRYPIYLEDEIINSQVPIWRKNKKELKDEDYVQFYHEKHFGFDEPAKHIHLSVDGNIRYNAILYIPQTTPFDYYTKEYEKGLELYSNGVLIMNKCSDLLPDYFSFVKGIVDSEDLSLNISRELLQHDRQLKAIAKNLKTKIKNELKNLLKEDREKYEKFYNSFSRQLKYGVYSEFGANKEMLEDLLMFYSSKEKKLVTLRDYIERMKEDQKYIYYACGENYERIEKLPQTEFLLDKDFEVLYFVDEVDEFAIKMLNKFDEKEFKSVSDKDLGIEVEEEKLDEKEEKESLALFEKMTEILKDQIYKVKPSKRLKNHPVCLSNEGDLSIEMEKVLKSMPDSQNINAQKILEINRNHEIYSKLKNLFDANDSKLELYTKLLYNQAILIEGLSIDDPVEFANQICEVML